MKGIPKRNRDSKIYSDGRTYDNKLYTFQENDHREMWFSLDIVVKRLSSKNNFQNIPSKRESKKNDPVVESKDSHRLNSNGLEIGLNPSEDELDAL